MARDDLSILGVNPKERELLETMGFISIEQIALIDRYTLGLGKQRGDVLIQRARNILANEKIQQVEVNDDRICVKVKELTDAVTVAVSGAMGIGAFTSSDNIKMKNEGNDTLIITREPFLIGQTLEEYERKQIEDKERYSVGLFENIKKKASEWVTNSEKKERQSLAKKGIEAGRQEIINFAKNRRFDGFWQNVFEEIRGNEIMKKTITLSLFSSYDEPLHVLILGDPGSSKSLAKEVLIRSFPDIKVAGANTTRAGLVCNMATGELGILAYSDQRLIVVDEFDKIPEGDIEYCYELLSNGKCSVHSARVHQDIKSNIIMIALANPKTKVFGEKPIENIGLSPILMSRFALIIKTENLEKEDRMQLLSKKFYSEGEFKKVPESYDQWVKLARGHVPQIVVSKLKVNEYLEYCDKVYQEYHTTPLRRDLRMGDYAIRIPKAIARAEFSDITGETIEKAKEILETSIKEWRE